MIQLYWSPRSRSISAIWLMEESGLPYERVLTDISTGAQKAPDYLKINPMGKVPALSDGDAALGEAAAICAYIADRYPETKLAPAVTDPRRARYLQWLFFSPGCIEPAITDRAFPRQEQARRSMLGYGDFDTVMSVLAKAVEPGPYLLGEQFTAADVVVGSTLRWGLMFSLLPTRPEFMAYVGRFEQRPALQRATALDQELAAA